MHGRESSVLIAVSRAVSIFLLQDSCLPSFASHSNQIDCALFSCLTDLPEAFRNSHISDDDVTFVGERGDQVRAVSLSSDDSGTTITLMRSSKAPAPAQSPTAVPAPAQ